MKKNYKLDYLGLLIELLKKCFVESFKVCDRFDGCGEYTLVIAVAIKDFAPMVSQFVLLSKLLPPYIITCRSSFSSESLRKVIVLLTLLNTSIGCMMLFRERRKNGKLSHFQENIEHNMNERIYCVCKIVSRFPLF